MSAGERSETLASRDRGADFTRVEWTQNEPRRDRIIEIGLVNNMPDNAVDSAERQFLRALRIGNWSKRICLHRFMIPQTIRSESAQYAMKNRYSPIENVGEFHLDALIVTGSEPRASRLQDETYWGAMTSIVDWSRSRALPVLWSCLASHLAVLYLDGIQRRPLRKKRSGVFAFDVAANPLTKGAGKRIVSPHSRWNEVKESDLVRAGYDILASSDKVGVDAFAKRDGASFLFLQGHPEYDPESLLNEYRRDVARWRKSPLGEPPAPPVGIFDRQSLPAIEEATIRASRGFPQSIEPVLSVGLGADLPSWGEWSRTIFDNWLNSVWEEKKKRAPLESVRDKDESIGHVVNANL